MQKKVNATKNGTLTEVEKKIMENIKGILRGLVVASKLAQKDNK